jgi:beta-phosphoglucomutase family hydrolase
MERLKGREAIARSAGFLSAGRRLESPRVHHAPLLSLRIFGGSPTRWARGRGDQLVTNTDARADRSSIRKSLDMLGLPSEIRACLFDLDGVLVDTAKLHAAAWKEMFDAFLRNRAHAMGSAFEPFDSERDYREHIDGKLRYDGVRSFLASRGIELPDGDPDDAPGVETVIGLGDWKNELVLSLIRRGGVRAYPGSVLYVRAVRDAGLHRAVVSASKNCHDILHAATIDDLFEVVIDGTAAAREHLSGKPSPDTFLAGARAVGVPPPEAAVFEDALVGVEAARAGGFGFVVGVDRSGQPEALLNRGADIVVSDLAELLARP